MAETLEKFVTEWGFCPHVDNGLCEDCQSNPSERSYSTGDMLNLNHERQVAIFNWCGCEDNEGNDNPYKDCPSVKCAECKDILDMSEHGEGGHIYPDGSVLCATCEDCPQ